MTQAAKRYRKSNRSTPEPKKRPRIRRGPTGEEVCYAARTLGACERKTLAIKKLIEDEGWTKAWRTLIKGGDYRNWNDGFTTVYDIALADFSKTSVSVYASEARGYLGILMFKLGRKTQPRRFSTMSATEFLRQFPAAKVAALIYKYLGGP